MGNFKTVIGFDDNLSNNAQEYALTAYAISKLRAARTPYMPDKTTKIEDVNDLYKPGLFLFRAGAKHTTNNSNEVLGMYDVAYLYNLMPDPDESVIGGHVTDMPSSLFANYTYRQIIYLTKNGENITATRYGRYDVSQIPSQTTNRSIQLINEINDYYNRCPSNGEYIWLYVEDIAMWVKVKRSENHTVEWHPAITWSLWKETGEGGSSDGSSVPLASYAGGNNCDPNTLAGKVGTLNYDSLSAMFNAYSTNNSFDSVAAWYNAYTVPSAAAVVALIKAKQVIAPSDVVVAYDDTAINLKIDNHIADTTKHLTEADVSRIISDYVVEHHIISMDEMQHN